MLALAGGRRTRGGPFTTTVDGARTRKRVSRREVAVHFGVPIAADERNGEMALGGPGPGWRRADGGRGAGLFVARTRDGGETWKPLRGGLPQEHAYDVVCRHALDASDGRVCVGSTTSNV